MFGHFTTLCMKGLISSKHASTASDIGIHFGPESSEIFCHPQKPGVGISDLGMQLFAQIPVCNAAFIT